MTAAVSAPRTDRRQLDQGTPDHRTRQQGGWLGRQLSAFRVVIDLRRNPTQYGRRNASIVGLSALVFGTLTGAKIRLVDWHTAALTDGVRTRVLVVHALIALVLTPLVVSVFLTLPQLVTRLLRRLREDEVIDPADAGAALGASANYLERWFNRIRALTAAPTLLYLVYLLVDTTIEPTSWREVLRVDNLAKLTPSSPQAVLVIVTVVAQAAVFYVAVTALLELLSASHAFGKLLLDAPIQVQPLHPDGCGGLWVIGRLLSLVLYVAAVLGAVAVCVLLALKGTPWVPTRRPEPYLLIGFYALLLPSAIVQLLWRSHQLMERRRDEILKPVAKMFNATIPTAKPRPTDDTQQLKAKGDRLQELSRQLRLLDDACPCWPLRMRRLRPVVVTAVLPVVIPVVAAVLSRLLTA